MFAITAATGRVGGAAVRTLLEAGHAVRVIVRDARKAQTLAALGCDVVEAVMEDPTALAAAFSGVDGVLVVVPPGIDQPKELPRARKIIVSYRKALNEARPPKVVALSSVGAQAMRRNTISELSILELELADVDLPITFLRPAWYIENAEWDVASAREEGVVRSFLQPVDRAIPMVSVSDAGRVAGELLMERWLGHRIVELHGPTEVSPQDLASAFSKAIGREVRVEPIPRTAWEDIFRRQGVKEPEMWMTCLDGFNEGWLSFAGEGEGVAQRWGRTTVEDAIANLVHRGAP